MPIVGRELGRDAGNEIEYTLSLLEFLRVLVVIAIPKRGAHIARAPMQAIAYSDCVIHINLQLEHLFSRTHNVTPIFLSTAKLLKQPSACANRVSASWCVSIH